MKNIDDLTTEELINAALELRGALAEMVMQFDPNNVSCLSAAQHSWSVLENSLVQSEYDDERGLDADAKAVGYANNFHMKNE